MNSIRTTAIALAVAIAASCAGPVNEAKRDELRALIASMRQYPDFDRVGEQFEVVKTGHGVVSRKFVSSATFDEVKAFYVRELTKDGWDLAEETEQRNWGTAYGGRKLVFRRGAFTIDVEYAGSKAQEFGWNYGVAVGWD